MTGNFVKMPRLMELSTFEFHTYQIIWIDLLTEAIRLGQLFIII